MSEKFFRFKTPHGDVTVFVHLPGVKGQVMASFAWCSQEDANKGSNFKHKLGRTIAHGKMTCKNPRFVGLGQDFDEDSDLNEVRCHVARYIRDTLNGILNGEKTVADLGVKPYNGNPQKGRFLQWVLFKFGASFLDCYAKELAA